MGEKELVSLKDGIMMKVFDDYIGNLIKTSNRYYEEEILFNFIDYIPVNGVIYDIGANIGNHTLFFSKYLKPKEIYSFEPSSDIFNVLDANVKINKIENIKLFNNAVGNKKGKGQVQFNKINTGASKVTENINGEVDIIEIDSLSLMPPDFVKIDVEGFEQQVLEGMNSCLINEKPIIWIEIHQENYDKVDLILSNCGYIQIDRWLDNYIYCHPDKFLSVNELFERLKNKALRRLNLKINEINLKYRVISEQNKSLTAKANTLKEEKFSVENKNVQLEKEVYILSREISIYKEQLLGLKVNQEKYESFIKELQKDKELHQKIFDKNYSAEIARLNEKLEEYKKNSVKKIDIFNENSSLKSENVKLNNIIVDLENKISNLENQLQNYNELESQKEYELEKLINSLNEKINTHLEVINNLDNEKQFLLETIKNLQNNQLTYDQNIEALHLKLSRMEEECKEKESQLQRAEKEYRNLQKEIQTKNIEVDSLNEKLLNKSKQITHLTQEKSQLVIENVDLKSELEKELVDKIRFINKEELFTIKLKEHDISSSKYKNENAKLKKEIELLMKQNKILNKKYDSLKNSKLGKATIKYWSFRKKVRGGK